ncbi:hypothetical protein Tco_0415556 [Tanacetum coccineum]
MIITHWTSQEEELLATCYITVFEDSQVRNDQEEQCFGGKILNDFNSSSPHKHTKYMINRKWAMMHGNCQKFNSFYKRLRHMSRSGENEVDLLNWCRWDAAELVDPVDVSGDNAQDFGSLYNMNLDSYGRPIKKDVRDNEGEIRDNNEVGRNEVSQH